MAPRAYFLMVFYLFGSLLQASRAFAQESCLGVLGRSSPGKQGLRFELSLEYDDDIQKPLEMLLESVKNNPRGKEMEFTVDASKLSRFDLGGTENLLINQATLELAALGYGLESKKLHPLERASHRLKGLLSWSSKNSYRIIEGIPSYVQEQAKVMLTVLKGRICCENHNAKPREGYHFLDADRPKYTRLTKEMFSKLQPGIYSFVFVTNEPFLRLGYGHHYIGESRSVFSAGDISIVRVDGSDENTIDYINSRSDTYQPFAIELVSAVMALWRQQIYPPHLRLLNWDNSQGPFPFEQESP